MRGSFPERNRSLAARLVLAFILFGSSLASADEPVLRYQILDPGIRPEEQGIMAEGPELQKPIAKATRLPTVKVRDAAFKMAGLVSEVSSMDDLDRDVLYSRARKWDLTRLFERYPAIERNKLERLKKIIAEEER